MPSDGLLVILDAQTLGDLDLSPIQSLFETVHTHELTRPSQTAQCIAGARVVVSNKVMLDSHALTEAEDLSLICIAATGTNNVDLDAARDLGITVTNVPGYSTPSAVSHTMAMYFHLAHHTVYHDTYTKSGEWSQSPIFTHLDRPWREPKDKVWGIIGLGAIGSGVAMTAASLGCHIIYHSPSGSNLDQPFAHKSLKDLLKESDVVSIHTPLTQSTKNMLGSEELALMKTESILINTSRGGIINEPELATALDAGIIAGAALDVMEHEPPLESNPLLSLKHPERLLVTPHIAGLSIESRQRLIREIAANIKAWQNGNPRNLV